MTNVRINRAREFAHVITAYPGIVVTPLCAGLRDSAAYRMIYCSRSSHLDTSKYTGKSWPGLRARPVRTPGFATDVTVDKLLGHRGLTMIVYMG